MPVFPAGPVITLEQNYRSTEPVLSAANGVIGLAKERFTKNLWTDRETWKVSQLVTVRDEADQAGCIVDGFWTTAKAECAERSIGAVPGLAAIVARWKSS